jgi:ribosomal protein S27E
MTLSEKVAYLKGVAEGLKFDPEKTSEGKLISIMMDILEHIALNSEENDDSIQALADQLDDVSDSLSLVEDYVYGEEFDFSDDEEDEDDAEEALAALEEDGFFELECPNCDDTLVVDKSVLDSGKVTCPGCGQAFEIELGYEDAEDDSDEE